MADREIPGRDDQPTRRRLDDPSWVDDIVSGAVRRATASTETLPVEPETKNSGDVPTRPAGRKVVRKKVVKRPVARDNGAGTATPRREPTMAAATVPGSLMAATSPSAPLPRLDEEGGGSDRDGSDEEDPPQRRTRRAAIEWTLVIVGSLVVAVLIKTFLFQAFYIPSASMESTLMVGDRVLVNKVSYDLHEVNRGDLVVFKRPEGEAGPGDEIDDLIKRVVALPGETVEVRANVVYIDGLALDEPYLEAGLQYPDFEPVTVPDQRIFVMGDNRPDSRDSRVFGPIDADRIVGRAFFRLWPPSSIGFL